MNLTSNKKKKEMLHVFAILFLITIVAAVLTYIVPAGSYQRAVVDNRTVVVADTYTPMEQTPVGLWHIFTSITDGWSSSNALVFLTFAVGAAVKVLEDTGFVGRALNGVLIKAKGKEEWILGSLSIIFSILGATGTFSNAVVAVVPIGVMLARRLGYDGLVGVAITYVATFTGFAGGWSNVFTTVIAQSIAELPILSGFGVRVAEHVLFEGILLFFTFRYARKIKKNPASSLCMDVPATQSDAPPSHEDCILSIRQKLSGLACLIGFVLLVYGTMEWNFSTSNMTAVFLVMALVCGLIGGLGVNGTFNSFVKGLQAMVYPAFLIGMAKGISEVLTAGNIIDTFIYWMAQPIEMVGSVFGAVLMFIFNFFFNFLISSGSGQALAVMPIMVPLADVTDITRQVAVEAYRFGDSFSNFIWPTAGTMMASIGLGGIEYTKWLKWAVPYVLALSVFGAIIVAILQMVRFGPF